MESIGQARQRLRCLPRTELGFYPTPLHRLERVSEVCDVEVYMKREDFSGMTLFGGNKIRKLEYLLGQARADGCDTVVTYGATQSNHAMETAAAARRCGMTPVLYLAALVEPSPEDLRANLLLDTILGAEVHLVPVEPGQTMDEALERARPEVLARIAELEAAGHPVCDLPGGGSNEVGVCGFADAFLETMEQMEHLGGAPDYLFTAAGTGGTLAGLAAGQALLGSGVKLVGVQVSPKDRAAYAREIAGLANRALGRMGAPETVRPDGFTLLGDYYAPGYEKPSPAANQDIRWLARTEGLFADPVYSGKCFHGMIEEIRGGRVPSGSRVLFLHTGGAVALFSEPEIIGDLNRP